MKIMTLWSPVVRQIADKSPSWKYSKVSLYFSWQIVTPQVIYMEFICRETLWCNTYQAFLHHDEFHTISCKYKPKTTNPISMKFSQHFPMMVSYSQNKFQVFRCNSLKFITGNVYKIFTSRFLKTMFFLH